MPTIFRSIIGFGLVLTVMLIAGCTGQVSNPEPEENEERTVTLYFYSDADLADANFDQPIPISRTVAAETNVEAMDRTLKLLFAGPTQEEQLTNGAKTTDDLSDLGPLYIGMREIGSVAVINFRESALPLLNSSAAKQLLVKGPIEMTLKQFPGITEVRYEIDGNPFDEWDA